VVVHLPTPLRVPVPDRPSCAVLPGPVVSFHVRTVGMTDHSPRALITVDELATTLGQGTGPVPIDVRWQLGGPSQYQRYLAGHLPGARWCDLETDLADPAGAGGRHPLPDPRRLETSLRAWGLEAESEVVVYDQGNSMAAARAWWVLRWAGVRQVRVLDGGYEAWVSAGHPVSVELPSPTTGTISVRPGSLPSLDADSAAEWGRAGRLVDVRAAERFRGEAEPIDPVAGHIPGASNLPTTANLEPSGHFLPATELRQRFLAAGAARDDAEVTGQPEPVGVYCGSGVTAAHTVLAMQVAGIEAVLYPGSWSEWITDPARPVETGDREAG
jgi:thiosulfate/3-mercaptopyruvate sulfurtransferase